MTPLVYPFLRRAGRILNSGQSRSILLTGNVHDLFALPVDAQGCLSEEENTISDEEYVPLVDFVSRCWDVPGKILVVYELNGPIRFLRDTDKKKVRDAWLRWRTGLDANEIAIERMLSSSKTAADYEAVQNAFDTNLHSAVGRPTMALEIFRQMCLCSRTEIKGKPLLPEDLIIIIEAADMVLPEGALTSLSDADRHRICICHDWFGDPGFMNGGDAVVLFAESASLLNHRVARLPQVIEIEVPAPDHHARRRVIDWFVRHLDTGRRLELWSNEEELARLTAGLSVHALLQLLKGAAHYGEPLTRSMVVEKVEDFIQSQLGEDVVEFKKPEHTLDDVVGFAGLKQFLRDELIPRFQSTGEDALPGAAVAGPVGGGKTFIFEALAAELDMVVLVLKNLRSQWYGQTDVTLERLHRVLNVLAKALIFVDEADTQFGGVGPEAHETERRLTGKIQAMMSDPRSRGRIIWLLMTARIHLLSPDIRRPGRVGDLIIPVLDPEGEDREAFLRWVCKRAIEHEPSPQLIEKMAEYTEGYSAASFASLRSELKASTLRKGASLDESEVLETVRDVIPPAIGDTRRYQTLQALVNCTRRRLLPDPDTHENTRSAWAHELQLLEMRGIR